MDHIDCQRLISRIQTAVQSDKKKSGNHWKKATKSEINGNTGKIEVKGRSVENHKN